MERIDLILDTHSTAYTPQAFQFVYGQYRQINLNNDDNGIGYCANEQRLATGHNVPDHAHTPWTAHE